MGKYVAIVLQRAFQPVDKLGGGVPDPISDQKTPFSTPIFRRGFQNPYPFSDLAP